MKITARAVICYLSFSGNTEEIAELIRDELNQLGISVDMIDILKDELPDLIQYDYHFLGTFTWDYGEIPDEMDDFISELDAESYDFNIFGSGDTQFGGDDLFCLATDKLAEYFNSKQAPLKIEQSPRGSQEKLVSEWVKSVLNVRPEKKG